MWTAFVRPSVGATVFPHIREDTECHDFSHVGALVNTDVIYAQFLPLDEFTWARSRGDEHQKANKKWHP